MLHLHTVSSQRSSSGAGLRREDDIDFDSRALHVERALSDDGKRIETPKSEHAFRTVRLSPQVIETLRQLDAARKAEKLKRGWKELPPWVFCSTTGTLLSPNNVRRAFRKVLKAADLPSHHTPHSLRHTFASILISEGKSPAYVQQQLGHEDVSLTINTYGAWLPSTDTHANDVLDDRDWQHASGHQK